MVGRTVRVNPFQAYRHSFSEVRLKSLGRALRFRGPGTEVKPGRWASVVERGSSGMRVAAVDLGKVRVGLAVSDELGMMAHPRPPLVGGHPQRLVAELVRLAKAEGIERFLVGLPLDRAGDEGPAATRARKQWRSQSAGWRSVRSIAPVI